MSDTVGSQASGDRLLVRRRQGCGCEAASFCSPSARSRESWASLELGRKDYGTMKPSPKRWLVSIFLPSGARLSLGRRSAASTSYSFTCGLGWRIVRRGCACLPQSAEYCRRGHCSSSPDGYLTSALPPLRGCCSRATPSSSATNKRLVLTRLRCWQSYLPHMPLSGWWIS